jgi:hypothetical protein
VVKTRPVLPIIALLLVTLVSLALAGCTLLDDINDILYPTNTPPPPGDPTAPPATPTEPVITVTATPTLIAPAPTETSLPTIVPPTPTATPTPVIDESLGLVFSQGGSIYRGGYWGADAAEVAAVARLESWDFAQGVLAMTRSTSVYVIDLLAGTLAEWRISPDGPIEHAQLLWGAGGQHLLYAAIFRDAAAPTFGRSVDLRAIDPQSGQTVGRAVVRDMTGLQLLRYDEATRLAAVIPRGDTPDLEQVAYYDLGTGLPVRRVTIGGQEAAISPQGRWLLTQILTDNAEASLQLYDLSDTEQPQPRVWSHPPNSHSAFHVWSPDEGSLAYLLREGSTHEASGQGLGLWLLDLTREQPIQVLDEPSAFSSLIGWSPDGSHIVGHHRGTDGESHYYGVRPEGGDRHMLSLSTEAQILGWMPHVATRSIPRVMLDPWPPRFQDVADDAQGTAQVVTQLVAAQVQSPEEELSHLITQYLHHAGWTMDHRGATIKRITEGEFAAQLPPFGIHILSDGQTQQLVDGNVLIDARREGDELGIIFGVLDGGAGSGSTVQPAFLLFHLQADDTWAPIWSPQGQRDWVTTNGEIVFVGEGLDELRVAGSSFGIEVGQDRVFVECRECLQRRFLTTWIKQGAGYVRQPSPPAEAPMHRVYWEMTEPTPYAIVFEALWRLRNDVPANDLLASPDLLHQIYQYGLLDASALLMPEEELVNGVRFSNVEGTEHFYALTKDDRLLHIQAVQ